MKHIISGLADKTEDNIERDHQDEMTMSRRYANITDCLQSQTSPVQSCEMLSNLDAENQVKQVLKVTRCRYCNGKKTKTCNSNTKYNSYGTNHMTPLNEFQGP